MRNQSDWISSYVFYDYSIENVIVGLINPIINELIEKKIIEKFFFIRYWEKGPHIRLRILPTDKKFKNEIIRTINIFAEDYFKKFEGEESKYFIEFNDYVQEIQRYGGKDRMEIAEKNFQDSSRTVITLIDNIHLHWDYSFAISFAIQMHLIFVKKNIIDLNDSMSFFELIYKNWIYNAVKLDDSGNVTEEEIVKLKTFFINSYNRQKDRINELTQNIWEDKYKDDWIKKWSDDCGDLMELTTQFFKDNKKFLLKHSSPSVISNKDKNKKERYKIYDSFVHMTNNRLGILNRDEAFIAFLIFNGLNSMNPNHIRRILLQN